MPLRFGSPVSQKVLPSEPQERRLRAQRASGLQRPWERPALGISPRQVPTLETGLESPARSPPVLPTPGSGRDLGGSSPEAHAMAESGRPAAGQEQLSGGEPGSMASARHCKPRSANLAKWLELWLGARRGWGAQYPTLQCGPCGHRHMGSNDHSGPDPGDSCFLNQ